jgi:hypothetical protein
LLVLASVSFYVASASIETTIALSSFALFTWSILAVSVLVHWRSHPWWSVIGGASMALTNYTPWKADVGPDLALLWSGLPYAVIILYGTRRLPR